ncbi:hypothetical protein NDU88_001526 [Pleurodeles waltl]|uniref:Uncharacterized protein n=1 Tax=Pleurodeles waltl TaxID=8319 RepID=A0AAV7ML59_PLEWA|nr:hypothetical protein NDU88_001526 [Pleurodeles waltl]
MTADDACVSNVVGVVDVLQVGRYFRGELVLQGGGQWRSVPYREDSTSIAAPWSARRRREKGGCGEQSLVQRRLLLPGAPRRALKSVVSSDRGLQVQVCCPLAGGAAGVTAPERRDLASVPRPEDRRTGSQADRKSGNLAAISSSVSSAPTRQQFQG